MIDEDNDQKKPKFPLDSSRLAGAVAAVAAASALSILVFGGDKGKVPYGPPQKAGMGPELDVAPTPVSTAGMLCLPGVVKTDTGCIMPGTEDVPVSSSADITARPIVMVSVDDSIPQKQVATCSEFAELYAKGWGGLTSADMRREVRVLRACGFKAIASAATPILDADPLTTDMMDQIDRLSLPQAGESFFEPEAVFVQDREGPAQWTLSGETLRGQFVYLGVADVDGDLEAEHLIEWRVVAEGGTLGSSGFGIVEDAAAPQFKILDPFTL